jgi:hypothetical protein
MKIKTCNTDLGMFHYEFTLDNLRFIKNQHPELYELHKVYQIPISLQFHPTNESFENLQYNLEQFEYDDSNSLSLRLSRQVSVLVNEFENLAEIRYADSIVFEFDNVMSIFVESYTKKCLMITINFHEYNYKFSIDKLLASLRFIIARISESNSSITPVFIETFQVDDTILPPAEIERYIKWQQELSTLGFIKLLVGSKTIYKLIVNPHK